MQLRAIITDIKQGLFSQPARTGLAFFSIAVGMAALTVLMAVLGGLDARSQQLIQELGVHVFAIKEAENNKAKSGEVGLTERHSAYLEANLRGCQVAGCRVLRVPITGLDGDVTVVATDAKLWRVRSWRMVSGRFLDEQDVRERARVAVIGKNISEQHQWRVGDTILLGFVPFRIIGIVDSASGASLMQEDGVQLGTGEAAVFIPVGTDCFQGMQGERRSSELSIIFIKANSAGQYQSAMQEVVRLMNQPDIAVGDLSWITADFLVRRLRQFRQTISITVGSVAFLCYLMGGITLMSIILANVRERIVEIGLRRALGAMPRDVGLLFLAEACAVTLAAAFVGISLVLAVLWSVQASFPVPLHLGMACVLVPLGLALVLGVVFSYWPARMASWLAPAEALRHE